ncbi:UNVERIFIED_CONTAM: Serine/arginine-rich SC35-like splicing factor SCL30A [Sesamum latifolium]|uniref:Serine/arginine-rich SC35-like splicing factor SCL30A n=1 Tax=Sesamum latifolium TaxID=2727402 RepID=A0AAW2Y2F4_9LAMI
MRGRSYTPSPPRGYGRRGRSPPRGGRYGRGDAPTSLLVRNLRHDCRPEDLRRPFGQFGPIKDIYLPRDYYTGDPRGFGFVQYVDPADAAEAKYQMDGQILQGRELTVVFAEENRKKPTEMRARERGGRSTSPREKRYSRERSLSRTPLRERSPAYDGPRNHSGSPVRERSPFGSRSRSQSPGHGQSPVRARSLSRSRSPYSPEYTRKPGRAGSPSQ